jgi:hypothetical protein
MTSLFTEIRELKTTLAKKDEEIRIFKNLPAVKMQKLDSKVSKPFNEEEHQKWALSAVKKLSETHQPADVLNLYAKDALAYVQEIEVPLKSQYVDAVQEKHTKEELPFADIGSPGLPEATQSTQSMTQAMPEKLVESQEPAEEASPKSVPMSQSQPSQAGAIAPLTVVSADASKKKKKRKLI